MQKGQITGRCGACRHPDRWRLELLLSGGASLQSCARKFGLHYDAVRRHWINHVPPERKAALVAGPVVVSDLATRIADENVSVLDHLRTVRAGLYAMYDAAVSAGDRSGTALLAGRLHDNLGIVARLTGQLAQSPLVLNQQNIFISPQFAELQGALLNILSKHPEARDDVIREFRRLESRAPQIEHDAA